MKNLFFYIVIITTIVACRTKQADKIVAADTAVSLLKADTANIKEDSHYFWISELDPGMGLVMKKTVPVKSDSLNAANMIRMINKDYPEIVLGFGKVSGDTIFVTIRKAVYLTQKMGTSGADAYLAAVTYNLTELNAVNHVDIRFHEGDHATPGVYSRTDFVRERSGH